MRYPVLSRREFSTGISVLALCAVVGLPKMALAQQANSVPLAELAEPGPLEDMVMGADNAPVTIIEYASMTCPPCVHFMSETGLKRK